MARQQKQRSQETNGETNGSGQRFYDRNLSLPTQQDHIQQHLIPIQMTIHKKNSTELHWNHHLDHYATNWQENTVTWQPINISYESETPRT